MAENTGFSRVFVHIANSCGDLDEPELFLAVERITLAPILLRDMRMWLHPSLLVERRHASGRIGPESHKDHVGACSRSRADPEMQVQQEAAGCRAVEV